MTGFGKRARGSFGYLEPATRYLVVPVLLQLLIIIMLQTKLKGVADTAPPRHLSLPLHLPAAE